MDATIHNLCPWRSYLYAVFVVVFPEGTDFPLVTGFEILYKRLAGNPLTSSNS